MKYLVSVFLFFSVLAIADNEYRLSLEQELYQTPHQVVFFVNKHQIKRWQNSNLFSDGLDQRLGEMFLSGSIEREKVYQELKSAYEHYLKVDQQLKKNKKSFNDLAKVRPHQKTLRVNQFIVVEGDEYYAKLRNLVSELLKKDALITDGANADLNNDRVDFYKSQKVVRAAPFKVAATCKNYGEKSVVRLKN